jgi:hypothetical protein
LPRPADFYISKESGHSFALFLHPLYDALQVGSFAILR